MHVTIFTETFLTALGGQGAASFYKAVGNHGIVQKIDENFLSKLRKMKNSEGFPQVIIDQFIKSLESKKGQKCLIKDELYADFNGPAEQRLMKLVSMLNLGIPYQQAALLTLPALHTFSKPVRSK